MKYAILRIAAAFLLLASPTVSQADALLDALNKAAVSWNKVLSDATPPDSPFWRKEKAAEIREGIHDVIQAILKRPNGFQQLLQTVARLPKYPGHPQGRHFVKDGFEACFIVQGN